MHSLPEIVLAMLNLEGRHKWSPTGRKKTTMFWLVLKIQFDSFLKVRFRLLDRLPL